MRMWVLAAVAAVTLAGCQSEEESFYNAPKALDKMSPEEVCTFYRHYLSNPDPSASARDIGNEQLRRKNCTP